MQNDISCKTCQTIWYEKGEFINFAAEAFGIAESRHKDIGKLTTSANDNLKHDLATRNENTEKDVSEK